MKNLKSLFFGFLILSAGLSSYGQTNKIDIGLTGGPSLISLGGNDRIIQLHKSDIGFSGGLFFRFGFNKNISLCTNPAYERKGSAMTTLVTYIYGNPLGEAALHNRFDYLTLPVLVRVTFGRKIQYFVNAGPYFGYLIKQTRITKWENSSKTSSDNTAFYKRFDTGISSGLGILVPVKSKFAISFEVRNNLGLYNVKVVPVLNTVTIKTNSTNFLIGFTYILG